MKSRAELTMIMPMATKGHKYSVYYANNGRGMSEVQHKL